MVILSLIQNFALLVALAALFQRVGARFKHVTLRYRVLSGLLFGAVGLVGMATPARVLPGIYFDGRSIILAVAGVFGGPVVAGIAAVICAAYRIASGGSGMAMGLAVIAESAVLGVTGEALRRRLGRPRDARFFLAVGVAVHLVMLACIGALPGNAGREVLIRVGPAILILYPLVTLFVGLLFQDFEEQARDRAALRESEARYRELFLAHPLPMWVYDLETLRFLAVNDATVEKYGYPREELLAMTIRDIRPPEDIPDLEASVAFSRAHPGHEDSRHWRHRSKDGRVFEVEISSHSIAVAGRPGRVVVANDVSERRHLERQLRQAQKMEAVGILAGGIAHDFNNLLQATLSTLQAASLQAAALSGAGSAVSQTLAEAEAQVQRGAQLTRQLLLFSRQTPAQWQRVDLATLVAEQASMLRRILPENITLRVEAEDGPLSVEADAGQLGQVVANLVVNARDSMPEGGTLVVSVARRNGEAVIEVRDTGSGIPDDVRERIFDPFFTTKAVGKGTGLGLSVVWGIVKEHAGRVEVDSEVGRGSTFRVVLPASHGRPAGATSASEAAEGQLPGGDGERILIVEDEEGARHALTELLSMLGYRVTAVASGEEVRTLDGASAFDVLLTDLRLPGVSGVELARELAGRWPALKVIVMSGYAPDDVAGELFAGGAFRFLQKPFDVVALARALWDALAGPPSPATCGAGRPPPAATGHAIIAVNSSHGSER